MKELRIVSRLRPTSLHSSARPLRIPSQPRPPTRTRLQTRPKSTLASTTAAPAAGHNPPRRSRLLPKLLAAGALASLALYLLPPSRPTTLNPTSFVPYTVTSKTAVSPTSFVLSLRPQHPFPPGQLPYLVPSGSWWDFQWSVQVKQPELQIQREYTPLPPPPPTAEEGSAAAADDDGELRFFVRRVEGGEVSRYLDARREGDTVEVRLGARGFTFNYLDHREENHVVCLAGGTGIATAMQIAHAVLRGTPGTRPHPDTRVRILWAVRRRSDVQTSSLPGRRAPRLESLDAVDHPTAVARQLLAMKALYGPGLDVRVAVDEEGTSFGEPELKDALLLPARATSRRGAPVRYPVDPPPAVAAACAEAAPAVPERIPPADVPGNLRRPVFVCGPDGFVERYAGRAVEVRGAGGGVFRTGGLLGVMNARYGDGEAWLVLGFP